MSDLQVNKQKQVMDIDTLVSRERVAENFAATQPVQREDVKSVEQTKMDQELVSDYLAGKYGEISDEDRVRLENTKDRNMSHLLVNNQKSDGDSPEMFQVKTAIIALEEMLAEDYTLDNNARAYERSKRDLVQKYDDAIAACENYITNRPWRIWPTGRRRKKAVKERLKRLKVERECFIRGLSTHNEYKEDYELKTNKDAINIGRTKIEEINQTLPEFREYCENLMSYGDEIYKTMSDETQIPDYMKPNAAEKPKLSTKAMIGYNKAFSYHEDTPSFKDMERKNGEANAIDPNTKWLTNQTYYMEFTSLDNKLKENPEKYEANKELIDELVALYHKDLFAADASTLFSGLLQNVNNLGAVEVTLPQHELRGYRDYLAFTGQALDMHGTCLKTIIEGLLGLKEIPEDYYKVLYKTPELVQRIKDAMAGL